MTSFKNVAIPALYVRYYEGIRQFDKDLLNSINENFRNLEAILNRGFSFPDNADCRLISFTSSATPNAENTVAHMLGKIPTGFMVYDIDKAARVYRGTTAWTSTNIYLKSDIASTAISVLIF